MRRSEKERQHRRDMRELDLMEQRREAHARARYAALLQHGDTSRETLDQLRGLAAYAGKSRAEVEADIAKLSGTAGECR
jgi:hypothetical protein